MLILLAAGTILLPDITGSEEVEVLPPYTVVYGENSERRVWDGSTQIAENQVREKHVEYLREILPK